MSHHHLFREDAPFGDDVWERIDDTVVGAATGQLSTRRLLHVEGPYGYGTSTLVAEETVLEEATDELGGVAGQCVTPLARVQKEFCISIRDIATYEKTGMPFGTADVAHAAIACAKREDQLLLHGSDSLGTTGLLNTDGSQCLEVSPWEEPGQALDDLAKAVGMLDGAGFHGPYALALAPDRYNLLFRRYPQGNMVEMEHVKSLVTEGVTKAPALSSGGVLIAAGRQFASIVLGQDLTAAFIGPAGPFYEFEVSETLALRLEHPGCVCVLD
jgi:uncharacterized linocin/CFP29 family protein